MVIQNVSGNGMKKFYKDIVRPENHWSCHNCHILFFQTSNEMALQGKKIDLTCNALLPNEPYSIMVIRTDKKQNFHLLRFDHHALHFQFFERITSKSVRGKSSLYQKSIFGAISKMMTKNQIFSCRKYVLQAI